MPAPQQRSIRFSIASASIVGDFVAGRQGAEWLIQGGGLMCGAPPIILICQPDVSIVR